MVVMVASPISHVRDIVLQRVTFLAAYSGRGAFAFWCVRTALPRPGLCSLGYRALPSLGLLSTILMGPLGVLAGVLAMAIGTLHLLLHFYFRDIIEEDYKTSTRPHLMSNNPRLKKDRLPPQQ